MFKTIRCCFSMVFWTSLALGHPEQGIFWNGADNENGTCTEVVRLSRMVGWKTIVGYTLDTNQNLTLCGESNENDKCCPVRTILTSAMNEQFNQSFTSKLYSISTVFSLSYKLFNSSFLNLLNHTKFELHYYLISSNDQQFDENSFFSDLFWDMEEYFAGLSSVNLLDSFVAFFDSLIRQLLSFHYNDFNLEESAFDCISKLSKDIKPFGNVPVTLGNQMKKSFQLVRIFSQSLRQGQEILNLLEKVVTPLLPCMIPIEELSYCSYCSEFDQFVQCSDASCANLVLTYCLKGLKVFEKEWLQYVDGLISFMECFDQYCNVENVARTIEQNIMEAIETFKKTSTQFFNEVENKCGVLPPNYREKRSPTKEVMMGSKPGTPPLHPSQMLIEKLKNIRVDIESRRDFINPLVRDACYGFLQSALPGHQDFNCSRVSDILEQKPNFTSYGHNSKESQFLLLSQKVKNISERMKNVLSSYRAFAKIDVSSSGFTIYSSGSGDDDDYGDGDDDEDNREGDDENDDDTFLEEGQKGHEKPGSNSEEDIAFERPESSCSHKHCHILWFFIFTALFIV